MLHVISYNVHFGKKLGNITQWLIHQSPSDILCLQEFPEDKINEFVHSFPKQILVWRFAPALRLRKKTYGELTVVRSTRIRIRSSKTLPLHINKMEKILLGKRSERSCIITACSFDRKNFLLVNTQLACVASTKIRHVQIEKILYEIAKRRIRRTLFIGDFNSWSIAERRKLIKYMKTLGFVTPEKRTFTHRIVVYRHQLDFIFGKNCTITDFTVDTVRFSDHYPLSATIHF